MQEEIKNVGYILPAVVYVEATLNDRGIAPVTGKWRTFKFILKLQLNLNVKLPLFTCLQQYSTSALGIPRPESTMLLQSPAGGSTELTGTEM